MHLMTGQALSISPHVMGCNVTQEVRVQYACDDVASTVSGSPYRSVVAAALLAPRLRGQRVRVLLLLLLLLERVLRRLLHSRVLRRLHVGSLKQCSLRQRKSLNQPRPQALVWGCDLG